MKLKGKTQYSKLKTELTTKYSYDIDAYIDGKAEFVKICNRRL
ncbi:GrpB family protein [Actinomyces sp. zg-332]|nr:GrpB family protein [Actinomyces sp. zg-332]QPK94555.1 GrpB family protein [Actinomyces sp. zg-332]